MAIHFPIREWKNESWYEDILKDIKKHVDEKRYSNDDILPDDYKMDVKDDLVLIFKADKKYDMPMDNLTENWNPIKVSEACFEVHLTKNRSINEVYVPL